MIDDVSNDKKTRSSYFALLKESVLTQKTQDIQFLRECIDGELQRREISRKKAQQV